MLEVHSTTEGRMFLDLNEVVQASSGWMVINGKKQSCTHLFTRYAKGHTILLGYDRFKELFTEITGKKVVETF
jgi:hypothetical protein